MVSQQARRIALVDLDAFFSSVEQIENPTLIGKPVLIGGDPHGRGVVAAASYEAREYGCRSAMPMRQALRACPHAVVMPVRHKLYREYSARVMQILHQRSPIVEQVSIDEAYVDLTPVSRTMPEAEHLAYNLRGLILLHTGLTASVGVSTNKMMAKVACESGKPNGFVVVPAGNETHFLHDLAVQEMPGIGPQYTSVLNKHGFHTIGQLADAPVNQLTQILGQWGGLLQHRAQGKDYSAVRTSRETKSISREETFARDVTERDTLRIQLDRMSEDLGVSLQQKGLSAKTVTLKLRFGDFRTITRSISVPTPTSNQPGLLNSAERLLDTAWNPPEPVRLIGLSASNLRLVRLPEQLSMLNDRP